jgi:streptogramin lyase
MVAGSDGRFWFVSSIPGAGLAYTSAIVRLDPAGTLHEFPFAQGHYPGGPTIGLDGNPWFTESLGAPVPTQLNLPVFIVNGVPQVPPSPTGYLLGHITASGQLTETPITGLPPRSDNGVVGFAHIAALADGHFWYATPTSNTVTRLGLEGTSTTFALPAFSYPDKVIIGPDGNYWIEESEGVGRLTPAGSLTQFPVAHGRYVHLSGMFVGPDQNLWFQLEHATAALRITMKGRPSVIVVSRNPRDGGGQEILERPDGGVWVLAEKNGAFGPLRLKSLRWIPPTGR